jgi:hypothetical protein
VALTLVLFKIKKKKNKSNKTKTRQKILGENEEIGTTFRLPLLSTDDVVVNIVITK